MMDRIRLNATEIKYITLFENLTGARVRDCVIDKSTIGFLVEKGHMGLAIGKSGANIARVSKVVGKNVMVIESLPDVKRFITGLFQPLRIKNSRVSEEGGSGKTATIEINRRDRSKVIGHEGSRIRIAKKLAERHFGISDIKIKAV